MAVCMIPNCRKHARADDPFCSDHRDRRDPTRGFVLTVCAIGVNRSGVDVGELDYAIDVEAFSRIDVREFLNVLDSIKRSVTVLAALAKVSPP